MFHAASLHLHQSGDRPHHRHHHHRGNTSSRNVHHAARNHSQLKKASIGGAPTTTLQSRQKVVGASNGRPKLTLAEPSAVSNPASWRRRSTLHRQKTTLEATTPTPGQPGTSGATATKLLQSVNQPSLLPSSLLAQDSNQQPDSAANCRQQLQRPARLSPLLTVTSSPAAAPAVTTEPSAEYHGDIPLVLRDNNNTKNSASSYLFRHPPHLQKLLQQSEAAQKQRQQHQEQQLQSSQQTTTSKLLFHDQPLRLSEEEDGEDQFLLLLDDIEDEEQLLHQPLLSSSPAAEAAKDHLPNSLALLDNSDYLPPAAAVTSPVLSLPGALSPKACHPDKEAACYSAGEQDTTSSARVQEPVSSSSLFCSSPTSKYYDFRSQNENDQDTKNTSAWFSRVQSDCTDNRSPLSLLLPTAAAVSSEATAVERSTPQLPLSPSALSAAAASLSPPRAASPGMLHSAAASGLL